MKTFLGIDIGGSFIKFGLITAEGQILKKDSLATKRLEPDTLIADLVELILKMKAETPLSGVGISLPGVINRQNQLVTSGALVDLYKRDLHGILTEKTQLEIRLVNDAKAIGLAERWLGAGQACDNFVCLPLGTGVGGCIVLDGKVIQGRTGAAGEFGMMLMGLGKTEPVGYESSSFYCGAVAGLCRTYSWKIGQRNFSEWETDIKLILQRAQDGQKEAVESLAEFYQNVAVLLLNISVAIDPEQILIGGGISDNQEIMTGIKSALNHLLTRYTDMSAIGLPKVSPCQLGNTAGMIGAVSQFI